MPKPEERPADPLRGMEQATYLAFREWPVLLVLRLKELAALKAAPPERPAPKKEKR